MTCGFFVFINLIEGNSIKKAFNDIRQKFWTIMFINWQLWIPASFINFSFMPIKFQVLFANFVSLIYNTALSFVHNSKKA